MDSLQFSLLCFRKLLLALNRRVSKCILFAMLGLLSANGSSYRRENNLKLSDNFLSRFGNNAICR